MNFTLDIIEVKLLPLLPPLDRVDRPVSQLAVPLPKLAFPISGNPLLNLSFPAPFLLILFSI